MSAPPLVLCFGNAASFRKWLVSNAASCVELLLSFHKVGRVTVSTNVQCSTTTPNIV